MDDLKQYSRRMGFASSQLNRAMYQGEQKYHAQFVATRSPIPSDKVGLVAKICQALAEKSITAEQAKALIDRL